MSCMRKFLFLATFIIHNDFVFFCFSSIITALSIIATSTGLFCHSEGVMWHQYVKQTKNGQHIAARPVDRCYD